MALGGFLARAGWEVDAIKDFVEIVAHYGGANEPAARGQDAADAAASHARGENVYGLPGLIDFFGEAPAKRVAKFLGYRETPAVHLPAAAHGLLWRECMRGGVPQATMHNARVAINALGVECSYDTFHLKLLFGFTDSNARHELQSLLGEVSDNGIIRLRTLISVRFGFDPEDKATRDAVKSMAMEHCFNPVADYLAKVEDEWDGTQRLDTMAMTHFNATDTPLNRAMVRKTMIAAVRRVRQPGCKFDNILVLESPEGRYKSTALRVLAGDENFSDQAIIGKHSREVQEQLCDVWIHENSELAGMKKAEVETVKAFASRQVDIARPAYGHFSFRQKRHSIETATTNSGEYLQSQTGNRRFWPLKVNSMIDIEKLRRDRDQLWGEAAHFESADESITLAEALWPDAETAQELRRVTDPWEEILRNIPDVVIIPGRDEAHNRTETIIHIDGERELVASADLLTYVLRVPPAQQNHGHGMRLATVMKRLGWHRPDNNNKLMIKGKQQRGYWRAQVL